MRRDEVTYLSDGHRISAWFYSAEIPHASAVVICPGYTGTKFAAFYEPYIAAFTAAGSAVLVADYRGWGESGGPRGEIVPEREVDDIRTALSYLESRPEVDGDRLWLFGVSFGGGVAVQAAALDRRVRCCVAVSPVTDGARWLREMRSPSEWLQFLSAIEADRQSRALGGESAIVSTTQDIMIETAERATTSVKGAIPAGMVPDRTPLWCADAIMGFAPVEVAHRVSRRGLLLFAVDDDTVVRPNHALQLLRRVGAARLVELHGGGHYETYVRHCDRIIAETLEYVGASLDPMEVARPRKTWMEA